MSQELGKAQRLILETVVALDRDRPGRWWRVSHILNTAYRKSEDLQRKGAGKLAYIEERQERFRERASAGIAGAGLVLMLEQSIRASGPRPKLRTIARWMEAEFNPTRVLASLEKRGLIERTHGGVRPTDKGRQL
jgi:hypothetical protein